jgi:lysyl-tRNA synthetase class 1
MSLPDGSEVAAEAAAFRPPFAHLAFLLQVPGVDLAAKVAAEKGQPLTDRERAILDERVRAARAWLETYAPERARVAVHDELPSSAAQLDDQQRAFLTALAAHLAGDRSDGSWTGDALQAAVFDVAREEDLLPANAFAALYAAFLDRPNGPRAGWLLASLAPDFVRERLRAAGRAA